MSLPNSLILRKEKMIVENAQSNTMLCKGNMNFREWNKKNLQADFSAERGLSRVGQRQSSERNRLFIMGSLSSEA